MPWIGWANLVTLFSCSPMQCAMMMLVRLWLTGGMVVPILSYTTTLHYITTQCRDSLKFVTLQYFASTIFRLVMANFSVCDYQLLFCRRHFLDIRSDVLLLLAHLLSQLCDVYNTLNYPPVIVINPINLSHLVQSAYQQFAAPLFNLTSENGLS